MCLNFFNYGGGQYFLKYIFTHYAFIIILYDYALEVINRMGTKRTRGRRGQRQRQDTLAGEQTRDDVRFSFASELYDLMFLTQASVASEGC